MQYGKFSLLIMAEYFSNNADIWSHFYPFYTYIYVNISAPLSTLNSNHFNFCILALMNPLPIYVNLVSVCFDNSVEKSD